MKKKLPSSPIPYSFLVTMVLVCLHAHAQETEINILYKQDTPASGDVRSQEWFLTGTILEYEQAADDFEVPAGQTWIIEKVFAPGRLNPDVIPFQNLAAGSIAIYQDENGKPGPEIYNTKVSIPEQLTNVPDLELTLPEPLTLPAGKYWVSVYATLFFEDAQWHWKRTDQMQRNPAHYRTDLQNPYGVPHWEPLTDVFNLSSADMIFTLYGTSTGSAAPLSPTALTVSYENTSFHLTWQDNSDDETGFVIERSSDGASFVPVATTAQNVTSYTDSDTFNPLLRYFYRVAALGANGISLYSNTTFDDIAIVLYNQEGIITDSQPGPSQLFLENWAFELIQSADDFDVPADEQWVIKNIRIPNLRSSFFPIVFFVEIYRESDFEPGIPAEQPLYTSSEIAMPLRDKNNPTLKLVLPELLTLDEGKYWISVYARIDYHYIDEGVFPPTGGFPPSPGIIGWYWASTTNESGSPAFVRDDHDFFEPGFAAWRHLHEWYGSNEPLDLIFTLLGATTKPSAPEIPPAPVATMATFIQPFSFVANWKSVEGTDYYELDVFSSKDSDFLPGYESKIVHGTSHLVTTAKGSKKYFYVVRAVNESGVSENSNVIEVAPAKKLILHAVCSSNPEVSRRWLIINHNPFSIDVQWSIQQTNLSGNVIATPGESYFTTQTVSGSNSVTISWQDDELKQQISTKKSTTKTCHGAKALAAGRGSFPDEENNNQLLITAYPNPITEDRFMIWIPSPVDEEVKVEIISLTGQRVYQHNLMSNTTHEIDATAFKQGLYILKTHEVQCRYIKLIKN